MKPWRKQFGIWVTDRPLSDDRGFIAPAIVGALAGSRRRSSGGGGPSYITSTNKGGRDTFTTTAIDTSGATLIVLGLAWFGGATEPTISDSQSNTWSNLTLGNANYPYVRLKYCLAPSTSASHTITSTHTNAYLGLTVAAFSGVTTYDSVENGGYQISGTTLSTGSVTPSQNNSLIVTNLGMAGGAQTPSIDTGFTIATHLGGSSGNWYGCDLAYLILATAAAKNPQWSWASSTTCLTRIAVFR